MAIDTAAKRRAVAHISRVWSGKGVTPDATPDQFWRQVVGWGYGGILASGAIAAAIEDAYYHIQHWHRRS